MNSSPFVACNDRNQLLDEHCNISGDCTAAQIFSDNVHPQPDMTSVHSQVDLTSAHAHSSVSINTIVKSNAELVDLNIDITHDSK